MESGISMLEFEEYKSKLNALKPTLDDLGKALKLDDARSEISELEAEALKDDFWSDIQHSQKVLQRTNTSHETAQKQMRRLRQTQLYLGRSLHHV